MYKTINFPLLISLVILLYNYNLKAQSNIFLQDSAFNGSYSVIYDDLPKEVEENSALLIFRDLFWTINDSGNDPVLYALDFEKHSVVQRIKIIGQINNDWEELCLDEGYLYIGDFGNNSGTRKDLQILKIARSKIIPNIDSVSIEECLSFYYPEQTDFSPGSRKTRFDCEAMIAINDSLFLFTKDWDLNKTNLYSISKKGENQQAKLLYIFDIQGLVTGASFDAERSILVLSGYSNYIPFLYFFTDFKANNFFNGKKLRVNFRNNRFYQTEGVAFGNNNILWISCESSAVSPSIMAFPLSRILVSGN